MIVGYILWWTGKTTRTKNVMLTFIHGNNFDDNNLSIFLVICTINDEVLLTHDVTVVFMVTTIE